MSLVKTIDFENGTDGNALTTALTGYSVISGTCTYSNAYAGEGALSARAALTTATAIGRITLDTTIAAPYYRGYRKLVTLPSANFTTAIAYASDGTTYLGNVRITTAGNIQMQNTSFVQIAISAHAFAANDEFRMEWNCVPGGTSTVRLFWGANINGTTPDETLSGTNGGSGSVGQIREGVNTAATVTLHWDGTAIDDTTWVGPAVPGTPVTPGLNAWGWNGSAWVAAVAKGWNGSAWVAAEAHGWDGQNWIPVNVTIPPSTSRFPGDPGQGKFYLGVSLDTSRAGNYQAQAVTIESRLSAYSPPTTRNLSFHRFFYGDTAVTQSECQWAWDNNRLPLVSFKGTPTSFTSGALDSSLATIAATFNVGKDQGKAIWWTYFHEPEDDFATGTPATQYRAAVRYIANYFKTAGCDSAAHVAALYMGGYTFSAGSGRKWWEWFGDWKGTNTGNRAWNNPNPVDFYPRGDANSVVDVLGLDVYNYAVWAYGSALGNYTTAWFDNMVTLISGIVKQACVTAYPIAIGESGWFVKQSGSFASGSGSSGADWSTGTLYESDSQAAFDLILPSIIANDVVAMSYWNNAITPGDYRDTRLLNYDPNLLRDKTLAVIADSPAHVYPPVAWVP